MTTSKILRAYHGDRAIKAKYLKRIRAHAKADEIISGSYWEHGKGCAVGCTIHGDAHDKYETELGLPTWLARLEDGMFERLYAVDALAAKAFPARFLWVIPVGADVSGVRDQFLAWLMDDPTYGTAHRTQDAEIKVPALEVAKRLRSGEGVSGPQADELTRRLRDAWVARARDARAAAWAAWVAWDACARDAWEARVAWDAWEARDERAVRAARVAFIKASVEELLRLLAAAPAPKRGKGRAA